MLGMLFACLLTACSASGRSGSVDLPGLDARLAAPAARPAALPSEGMTADQVENVMARDRAALLQCGADKAAIVGGYSRLRTLLMTGKR